MSREAPLESFSFPVPFTYRRNFYLVNLYLFTLCMHYSNPAEPRDLFNFIQCYNYVHIFLVPTEKASKFRHRQCSLKAPRATSEFTVSSSIYIISKYIDPGRRTSPVESVYASKPCIERPGKWKSLFYDVFEEVILQVRPIR